MGMCEGCSRICKQFFLLLWKNFILQIRRPIGTAFELVLPVLAVIVVIGLRFGLFRDDDRCFVTFDSDPLTIPSNVPNLLLPGNLSLNNFYNVFYTPRSTEAEEVARILQTKLPSSTFNFTGFNNESEMVADLQARESERIGCLRGGAGIVFEQLSGNDLSYKIRLRHEVGSQNTWDTDRVGPAFQLPGPRAQALRYLSEGFLHIQQLVGESIIQWKAQEEDFQPIKVSVRQFPYPPYTRDIFLQSVGTFLPLLLVMAFLYSAGIFVKELVLEKESRIRESMLMMGLKQWILWASWYLKQFLFLFITVIIFTILLKIAIFPNSDFLLLLIFFIVFILSIISFCFFVSVWFDSARVGLIVGFVAWFINYFPFIFLASRYDTLPIGAKIGACILSNTCMGLGVTVIARLEQREEGLKWTNAASPLSVDDSFNVAWVLGMFLIDSLLYMLVAWYINGVKPGQYGVPKPFYFPCLPSYWCGKSSHSKNNQAGVEGIIVQDDPSSHEEEPKKLAIGITIRNLTKIYSPPLLQWNKRKTVKKAVDNLSLNMYKGQITALLGHNGAGKTTTMSILTGLYTPTSGTAEINGYSILRDMDQIRHSLGICPQHNILFDRLTVSEHLSFFLRLKGVYDRKRVRQEVSDMIADLQLTDKGNIQASRLSGGMKRKLSVGIALVGGSEVVILDEPTSGMDPYARRATWDLLSKHKQNRTMLLTTHFMDEADLLGDRIAIMAEGKLCCSGSSLFLKSRYGAGYHMVIVKEPNCVSLHVEELIHSLVPSAKKITDVGAELSFMLPSSAAAQFPELFDSLDAHKADLGISSFGVSVTTMEEVFIKVGKGTDETLENRVQRISSSPSHMPLSPPPIGQTRSPPPPSLTDTTNPQDHKNSDVNISNPDNQQIVSLPGAVSPTRMYPSIPDLATTPSSNDSIQLSYKFEPNTGVVLWFQQFWALFLKRFYNSIRFYGALVSQLFLPLLFVLGGLVIIVTVPNRQEDDAPRALLMNNSGLDSDNSTVFFAQLGEISNLNLSLQQLNASDILATNYFDFTENVESIKMAVENNPPTTISQCCQYKHQLLDKFCATRRAGELSQQCDKTEEFGYGRCVNCLTCCNATNIGTSVFPTCSRPFTLFRPVGSNSDLCPTPPSLSVSSETTGALDSLNTYTAEYLLNQASEIDPLIFFHRFQAGFTLSAQDPIFSVCDCQRNVPNIPFSGACLFLDLPSVCDSIGECPVYSLVTRPDQCPAINATSMLDRNGSLCDAGSSDCYSVDATSGDLVREAACQNVSACAPNLSSRSVSSVYPDQPSTPEVTVWYNNAPFHMSPAALNAFHNLYLKQVAGQDLTLTVINHPLPRNATSKVNDAIGDPTGFALAILVVFGYSFLLASFVLFLVKEKESKAKHLQFVSGVSSTSYWLSTFIWDLINALIPIALTIILFAAFQVDAFSGQGLAAVFLILLLTCWASIPFTYIFSFLFSNSLTAFGILMLIFFFVSMLTLTVVFLVQFFESEDTARILHYIFLVFPTYGLSAALNDIYINQLVKETCEGLGSFCDNGGFNFVENPLEFSRPGVGVICVYLFVEGIIFFSLTLLIQQKFFYPEMKRFFHSKSDSAVPVKEPLLRGGEDDDVTAERKKVASANTTGDHVVVINDLVKVYSSHLSGCSIRPAKTAVAGVNLVIPHGECFGLLGVNGAGKTTTFSILTGDIPTTSGTAIIAGHDIQTNIKEVQQRIGYCPQFDALIERLTGQELLTMFARLRGVPEKQIKEVVDTEIRRLDLQKYGNKRCGTYSGGNKRKLSTAIALVGNPPIIMLDEPTTGMDPNTRRYLWDVLTNITQEGRSIILTSHSMEECEALCTRLAIMVNGKFKCLGSIQHLKTKYGSGFTLQAKVKLSAPPEDNPFNRLSTSRFSLRRANKESSRSSQVIENPNAGAATLTVSVEEVPLGGGTHNSVASFNPYDTTTLHIFIRESFRGALLIEEHQGAVTYQLPSAGITWSSVFKVLESNKEKLGIVDYSVSQTTLEQVFINFAKEQQESDL